MSEQDASKTKQFQKVPFQHFEAVTRSLGLSDAELAIALGYAGSSTLAEWRKNSEAPKVAYIAAQELVRRSKPNAPPIVIDKSAGLGQLIILQVDSNDDRAFLELMLERTKGIKIVFRS